MSKWRCSEKYRNINRILDVLNLVLIATLLGVTIKYWSELPGVIPTHYDLAGKVDAYGSKNTLFIIFPFIVLVYLLMRFFSNRPSIYNYVVKLTNENREEQYNLGSTFMRVFSFEVVLLFSYIQSKVVYSAVNRSNGISLLFIPVIIVFIIITLWIYIKKSKALV